MDELPLNEWCPHSDKHFTWWKFKYARWRGNRNLNRAQFVKIVWWGWNFSRIHLKCWHSTTSQAASARQWRGAARQLLEPATTSYKSAKIQIKCTVPLLRHHVLHYFRHATSFHFHSTSNFWWHRFQRFLSIEIWPTWPTSVREGANLKFRPEILVGNGPEYTWLELATWNFTLFTKSRFRVLQIWKVKL